MKKWKHKGTKHYKHQYEPLDLIASHGPGPLNSFCLGNIMKYADRNMGTFAIHKLEKDLDKIIHYAEILKEELCQPKKNPDSTVSVRREQSISEEGRK